MTPIRVWAHQIHIFRGPRGNVYSCPHCKYFVRLNKPINWGDTAKVRADIGRHIRDNHSAAPPRFQRGKI